MFSVYVLLASAVPFDPPPRKLSETNVEMKEGKVQTIAEALSATTISSGWPSRPPAPPPHRLQRVSLFTSMFEVERNVFQISDSLTTRYDT